MQGGTEDNKIFNLMVWLYFWWMLVLYASEWVVPATWKAKLLVSRKFPTFALLTTEEWNKCKVLIPTWNIKLTSQWSKSAELTCGLIWIFLCGFFCLSLIMHHTVSSVLSLSVSDFLACLPKLLLGWRTQCSFVLYVFSSSHYSENDQPVPFWTYCFYFRQISPSSSIPF